MEPEVSETQTLNMQFPGDLKLEKILPLIHSMKKETGNELSIRILFLRNYTTEPIIPFLEYLCYKHGITPSITTGTYNGIFQDIFAEEILNRNADYDLIIVSQILEHLDNELSSQYVSLTEIERKKKIDSILLNCDNIIKELTQRSKGTILFHNFSSPAFPFFGICDNSIPCLQCNTIRKLNSDLIQIVNSHSGVYILDVEKLQSTIGSLSMFDSRMYYLYKNPYSQTALAWIASEYLKYIFALKGITKKCLILDCDNTLWGGIIGEDGLANIEIGEEYPGIKYLDFQKSIINLYNKGIMLAIASKNNEEDVIEVFDRHPGMVLKKEHFLVMKINWNDKASSIKEIASELNIGLENIVFIDDNIHELSQVNYQIPEIVTLLAGEILEGTFFRDLLFISGLFDTLTYSNEDKERNKMYASDIMRDKSRSSITNLDEYLNSLEMEIMIENVDELIIPRASQLTQKTNQFNLTTKRYSESEIRYFMNSSDIIIRTMNVSDKFGSQGMVGLYILKMVGKIGIIDTFLLSCRVIGRAIEDVLLWDCIETARLIGCTKVRGSFIPTKKNSPVSDFYLRHSFYNSERNNYANIENERTFEFDLKKIYPNYPRFFKKVVRC